MEFYVRRHFKVIGLSVLFLFVFAACIPNESTIKDNVVTESPKISQASELVGLQSPTSITINDTSIPNTLTVTKVTQDKATKTPTPYATLTLTPTEEHTVVKLIMDGKCMSGPGYSYEAKVKLLKDATYSVVGKNEGETWIAIEYDGESCWISGDSIAEKIENLSVPVLEAPPVPTSPPTVTPVEKGMKVFYLVLETGGPFGCGDSLVYNYTGIKSTGKLEKDITNVLKVLFRNKSKFIGNSYNPIYQSNLNVKNISINYEAHHANIHLGGTFIKPKNACESERMRAQIWNTVLQFDEINSAQIWVNNKLLGDLLYVGNK